MSCSQGVRGSGQCLTTGQFEVCFLGEREVVSAWSQLQALWGRWQQWPLCSQEGRISDCHSFMKPSVEALVCSHLGV